MNPEKIKTTEYANHPSTDIRQGYSLAYKTRGCVYIGSQYSDQLSHKLNDLDHNRENSIYFGKMVRPEIHEITWTREYNQSFFAGAIDAGREFILLTPLSAYTGSRKKSASWTPLEIYWLYENHYIFSKVDKNKTLCTAPTEKSISHSFSKSDLDNQTCIALLNQMSESFKANLPFQKPIPKDNCKPTEHYKNNQFYLISNQLSRTFYLDYRHNSEIRNKIKQSPMTYKGSYVDIGETFDPNNHAALIAGAIDKNRIFILVSPIEVHIDRLNERDTFSLAQIEIFWLFENGYTFKYDIAQKLFFALPPTDHNLKKHLTTVIDRNALKEALLSIKNSMPGIDNLDVGNKRKIGEIDPPGIEKPVKIQKTESNESNANRFFNFTEKTANTAPEKQRVFNTKQEESNIPASQPLTLIS